MPVSGFGNTGDRGRIHVIGMFIASFIKVRSLVAGSLLAFSLVAGMIWGLSTVEPLGSPLVTNPQVAVANMLRQRFETLLEGDLERIRRNYAIETPSGESAWAREKARTEYFRRWLDGGALPCFRLKDSSRVGSRLLRRRMAHFI